MKKTLLFIFAGLFFLLPHIASAYHVSVYTGGSVKSTYTVTQESANIYRFDVVISDYSGLTSDYKFWVTENTDNSWHTTYSENYLLSDFLNYCQSGEFSFKIDASKKASKNNYSPYDFKSVPSPCDRDFGTTATIPAGTWIYFDNSAKVFGDGSVYVSFPTEVNAGNYQISKSITPKDDKWVKMTQITGTDIYRATVPEDVVSGRVSFWNGDNSTYDDPYAVDGFFNLIFDAANTKFTPAASVTSNYDDTNAWCYNSTQQVHYSTLGSWGTPPLEAMIYTDQTYVTEGEIFSYTLSSRTSVAADQYIWEWSKDDGKTWETFKETTTSSVTIAEAEFPNVSAYYRLRIIKDGTEVLSSNTCYVGFALNCGGDALPVVVYEQDFGTVSDYKQRRALSGMTGYTFVDYPKSINDGYYALVADPYYCGCGDGSTTAGSTPDVTNCMPAVRDTCERVGNDCSTWFRGFAYPAADGVKLRDHTLAEQSDNASAYGLTLMINYSGTGDTLAYSHQLDATEKKSMVPGARVRLITYVASPAKSGSGSGDISISASVTMGIAIEFRATNATTWQKLTYVTKTVSHHDNWVALVTPDFILGREEGDYRLQIFSSTEGGAANLGNDVLIDDIRLEACQPSIKIYYEDEDGTQSVRKYMDKEADEYKVEVPEFDAAVLGKTPCVLLFEMDDSDAAKMKYTYIGTMTEGVEADGSKNWTSTVKKNYLDRNGKTVEFFDQIPDSIKLVAIATTGEICGSATDFSSLIDDIEEGKEDPTTSLRCYRSNNYIVLRAECHEAPTVSVASQRTQLCLTEDVVYPTLDVKFSTFCDTAKYSIWQNGSEVIAGIIFTEAEMQAGEAHISLNDYKNILNWEAGTTGNSYQLSFEMIEIYNGKEVCSRYSLDLPAIYIDPFPDMDPTLATATLCYGDKHTFAPTVNLANTFKWEVSEDNGSTWTTVGTNSTYTEDNATSSTMLYRVSASYTSPRGSVCGPVTSTPVSLKVMEYPEEQTGVLNNVTRCKGSKEITLPNPYKGANSYSWEYRTSSTADWEAAGTDENYIIPTSHTTGYQYRVTASMADVATGVSCPSPVHSPVELTELEIPVVAELSKPSMCKGQTDASITAAVTGDYSNVQWYLSTDAGASWSAISGATSLKYTFPSNAQDGWQYKVLVTNVLDGVTCSDGESNAVTLEVQDVTASASASPDLLTCTVKKSTLSVSANHAIASYSWTKDGAVISDLASPEVEASGTYNVTVTTAAGCEGTSSVTVSQSADRPVISISANPSILNCNNSSLSLTASATAGGSAITNASYQWEDADGNILTDDAGNTDIESIVVTTKGTYYVTVTDNGTGCDNSASKNVTDDYEKPGFELTKTQTSFTCKISQMDLGVSLTDKTKSVSYQWEDSLGNKLGNGSTQHVTAAGGYKLTVTDNSNGCSDAKEIKVALYDDKPSVSIESQDGTLTCDVKEVSVTAAASLNGEAASNVSYAWKNASGSSVGTGATLSGITSPGVYEVTATLGDTGCEGTRTVEITQVSDGPSVKLTFDRNTLTCKDGEGEATITAETDAAEPEYSWEFPVGTQIGTGKSITVSTAGTYKLTIKDKATGCSNYNTCTIYSEKDVPSLSVTPTSGTITCSVTTIQLNAVMGAGGENMTKEWFKGGELIGNASNYLAMSGGTYTFKLTNPANGCSTTASVTIGENTTRPGVSLSATYDKLTCTNPKTTISSTVTAQTTNLSYSWSSGETSQEISKDAGGDYTLTVTNNDNGCQRSATKKIEQDKQAPELSIEKGAQKLTCDVMEMTLTARVTDLTPNVTYAWEDRTETTAEITINKGGTYKVTATNSDNGCTADKSETIEASITPPTVSINAPITVIDCNNEELTLSAVTSSTEEVKYVWTNEAGTEIGTDKDLKVSEKGTYKLKVTEVASNCSGTAEKAITDDKKAPEFSLSKSSPRLTCTVKNIDLSVSLSDPSLGVTYQWKDSLDNNLGTEATQEISAPGKYSLTVTNTANGCSDTKSIQVALDNANPTVAVEADKNTLTCSVTSITLTAVPSKENVSYAWTKDGAEFDPKQTGSTLVVTQKGEYAVTITDNDNGCTGSDNLSITQDTTAPVVTVDAKQTELNCNISEITITASVTEATPNVSYAWKDAEGTVLETDADIVVKEAGTYYVTVTNDDTGCQTTESQQITVSRENPAVQVQADDDELTCDLTSITLTAVPSKENVSYSWTKGGAEFDPKETGSTLDVDEPGTYEVTITDKDNGCTAKDGIEITQDIEEPEVSIKKDHLQFTCDTVKITLTADASNVSYLWDDGEVGQNRTVEAVGTYSVQVKSLANGCTNKAEISLIEDVEKPALEIKKDHIRFTCDTTSIILTADASNVSYVWDNQETGKEREVKNAGNYYVEVKSLANGCKTNKDISLEQNVDKPSAAIKKDHVKFTCDTTSIILTADASDVTYLWSDQSTEKDMTVTAAGTYELRVKSTINGCLNDASISLDEDVAIPAVEIKKDHVQFTCDTTSIILSAEASDVSYLWSDNTTERTLTAEKDGEYKVSVKSLLNGCLNRDSLTLAIDTVTPALAMTKDRVQFTCDTTSIILTAVASDVSYLWSDNTTGQTLTAEKDGEYKVRVKSLSNGCLNRDSLTLAIDTVTPALAITKDHVQFTCDTTSIILTAVASDVSYLWSDNTTGQTLTVGKKGEYKVRVKSLLNGCFNRDSLTLAIDTVTPALSLAASAPVLNCDDVRITLKAAADSVSYSWSTGATADSIVIDAPGYYSVTIKSLVNGCFNSDGLTMSQDVVPPALQVNPSLAACYPDSIDLASALLSTDAPKIQYFADKALSQELDSTMLGGVHTQSYYVLATAANFCTTLDSVRVAINELEIELMPDTAVCAGEQVDVWARGAGIEAPMYQFSMVENGRSIAGTYADSIYSARETVNGRQVYYVKAVNGVCVATGTIELRAHANPVIKVTDINGLSFSLVQVSFGQEPYSYSLDGGEFVTDTLFTAEDYGSHYVMVTDRNGCESTVDLYLVRPNPGIIIPPYFTPNGDGKHDKWIIENLKYYPSSIVELYDRYGRLLIRFDETYEGWDGSYNGHQMPSDDYWYLILQSDLGRISGHITLKR